MKKFIFIPLFFIPFLLRAQVPGYEGKRFMLHYNLGVAPNFIQAVYNSSFTAPFQIHLIHSISAEYVLGRRFSMEGEFMVLDNKPVITEEYTDANGDFEQNVSYPLDINMTGIGLNFVFYYSGRNAFAPVGNYFKLKMNLKNFNANGNFTTDSGTIQRKANGTLYGIGMEFGHHIIVKDRVVLSGSLSFDFNLPIGDALDNETTYYVYNHFLDTYIIYLKFGIGGLLF